MAVGLDRRLPYVGRCSAGIECHNRMDLVGFCSSFCVPFPLQSHARMGCFIFNASMQQQNTKGQIFLFQVLLFLQEQHNIPSMLWGIKCQGRSNGHCFDELPIYKGMKALVVLKKVSLIAFILVKYIIPGSAQIKKHPICRLRKKQAQHWRQVLPSSLRSWL